LAAPPDGWKRGQFAGWRSATRRQTDGAPPGGPHAALMVVLLSALCGAKIVVAFGGIEGRGGMPSAPHQLNIAASTRSIREIAAYLQDTVGRRVSAAMAGLADARSAATPGKTSRSRTG
jgi:hypothetical protein